MTEADKLERCHPKEVMGRKASEKRNKFTMGLERDEAHCAAS